MKKRSVLLAVGLIFLATIVFLGVGCGPEPVSKAEYQAFQETTDARLSGVEEAVKGLPKIQKGISGIQEQIKDLQADILEKEAERQKTEIESRLAGIEKDIAETKDELKDLSRSYQPPPPCRLPRYPTSAGTTYIKEEGSIWIERSDNYEFIITPNVEVFIDGRPVISHEIVYLTRGWYKCRSDSLVLVKISWRTDP